PQSGTAPPGRPIGMAACTGRADGTYSSSSPGSNRQRPEAYQNSPLNRPSRLCVPPGRRQAQPSASPSSDASSRPLSAHHSPTSPTPPPPPPPTRPPPPRTARHPPPPACPSSRRSSRPLSASHSLTTPSSPPLASQPPSGLTARLHTAP